MYVRMYVCIQTRIDRKPSYMSAGTLAMKGGNGLKAVNFSGSNQENAARIVVNLAVVWH